jgi:ABC-type oligopeptide transport system ATPase subunit
MDTLLQVRDLKKYFPVTRSLLKRVVGWVKADDGVSFAVAAGETFGLVGESGCGKSTLGKTILSLHRPTAGDVRFEGRTISGLPAEAARRGACGVTSSMSIRI